MEVTVASFIVSAGIGGKFVVIVKNENPDEGVILFSDFTRDFQHRDIVERWEKANATSVAAAGYRMAGGGWWKLSGGKLTLYGRSAAYGRFDVEWVRKGMRAGMVAGETEVDVK